MSTGSVHPQQLAKAKLSARAWLLGVLCLLLAFGALAQPHVASAQAAERIQFRPGQTSTNVSGYVTFNASKSYVLQATAGQQMTVGAANSSAPYFVTITDPRGVQIGAANSGQSWSGILPANGDYYLVVSTFNTVTWQLFYNLVITIPGALPPTAVPPQPPSTTRINFAPGATSATVSGAVSSSRPQQYVLRAMAGQTMAVSTNSNGPFQLSISGADGTNLGSTTANQALTVYLPRTQDYYILLQGPADAPAANFYLTVTVTGSGPAPTPTPVRPAQPQRINFAPGAISATVNGSVSSSRPAAYVLKALAGQDMTVQFYGGGPYQATLSGADGSFLGSANAGGTINTRLPRTQDYYINVVGPADAPASNFTMVVTIVGSNPPPTAVPSVQRINFAPGAVSATVNGTTPQDYVLKALRGQTMYVEVFSNGAPVQATIATASGQVLGSANQVASWSGTLPATQDYYFRVRSGLGGGPASFTLRVTIY